ncbi:hypothetical protein Lbys_3194 [Leadbetterella byssophila DSM 17132]|uniref:Uncharacterized protein n=1 Tax=Leadbetterella byssophila (strain DSM 17132 / JCM 16389 / KACC 11308 / NBRC 106382 / 4M15) TaxID=649349 RepID=E4RVU5_LEAB4|nr:glucoamylase family protein [Leadbetterella byssophila]ADQ18855.1 hypothetical protein Lbys_3194 [Leadbetterella byssophila DSM 17132]
MTRILLALLLSTSLFAQDLSDEVVLEKVQKATFQYFWEFGHPVSGLARERSNQAFGYGDETCTTGGTGMGIMAMIVASERNWVSRKEAAERILKISRFLEKSPRYKGAFPHWIHGETGATLPFSPKDDGGDLVETAFLIQGLLTARAYFDQNTIIETELREIITRIWEEVDWNAYVKDQVLYWHWSPNHEWAMNFALRGYNETLITYILASASPTHPIDPNLYHEVYAKGDHFYNGKTFYDLSLPLGFDYGGPLFFTHYSFLGLDPRNLKDRYADYWEQNVNHALINYRYCVENPKGFKNYGPKCWGLTASDSPKGYDAHSPTNDIGVITPTAALSSFPYTPKESMEALRYFYEVRHKDLWGPYGFYDAFSDEQNWVASSYLAIDQGPIVVMIENYRTGLIWKLFMQNPEIQIALKKLGFTWK